MVTASHPSFDTYRANTTAALRLLVGQQHWREQMLKLEQRRLERDREALEGMLESLRTARDWTDFAIATQSVWRDYFGTSTALWQEGFAAAMQDASTWSETARELAQQWQDACGGARPGASNAPGALPMREWMNAFERAVNGAAHPGKSPGSRTGDGQAASESRHGH
ncbi:MAG TPA: hypothetical protein VMJ11_10615 [Paraburkholderia sp.]|uniref:hypothetical protein n=1 Tax=Paraburkholderia sp. TaxID=1926495 RepID=UPI002D1423D4|nr:hypothetical protein [Paraburkholderia sp.]HTR07087.1 hypothetical protein [Paraburkholderia sp.]